MPGGSQPGVERPRALDALVDSECGTYGLVFIRSRDQPVLPGHLACRAGADSGLKMVQVRHTTINPASHIDYGDGADWRAVTTLLSKTATVQPAGLRVITESLRPFRPGVLTQPGPEADIAAKSLG